MSTQTDGRPRSKRRQRSDSNGANSTPAKTQPAPGGNYQAMIDTFSVGVLRELLGAAAPSHAPVAAMVASKQKEIVAAERAKVHNFDGHSKSIWRVLAAGDRVSGSKAYDASTDALTSIEGSISIILENTPAHASFGTNKSALLTLRKMGKSIALSGPNAMAHKIDQSLTDGEPLENAMLNIVNNMDEDEKRRMR